MKGVHAQQLHWYCAGGFSKPNLLSQEAPAELGPNALANETGQGKGYKDCKERKKKKPKLLESFSEADKTTGYKVNI